MSEHAKDARVRALEFMTTAVGDGLEIGIGHEYVPGALGRFSELRLEHRPEPLRAVQITFESGLADCLIVVTSVGVDRAVLAARTVATSIVDRLGVNVQITDPDLHEFVTVDDAFEQLEALYNESCVEFTSAGGDMLVIFGAGLVETVSDVLERSPHLYMPAAPTPGKQTPAPSAQWVAGSPSQTEVNSAVDAIFAGETPQAPVASAPDPAVGGGASTFHVGDGRWSDILTDVEVEVSAELGSTALRLGDVDSLNSDSILTLDQHVDDLVTVFVNGAPYATARMIVVDGHYGIEVVELLSTTALV